MKDYHTITARVELTDGNVSDSIIPTATDDMYLYLDKITLSVFKPADGEGVLEIQDNDGAKIWKTNVDGIKDISLPFGKKGILIGKNKGAQAMLTGANMQASVSLALEYHLDTE